MKTTIQSKFLIISFLAISLFSCKKKDNASSTAPTNTNTISPPDNSSGYITYKYNNVSVGDSTDVILSSNPIYNTSVLNQALTNVAKNGDYFAFQWGEVNTNNVSVKEIIVGTSNTSGESLGLILASSQSFTVGNYLITNNFSQGATVIATALFSQNEARSYKTSSLSGNLVVSNIDNTYNRISGTFNFTETKVDTNGLLPAITYTITNGVYHNVPFQKL